MNERILVADDEPDIADLVCLYLQNENFQTIPCYSGREALEQIQKEKPDLAILDIMMPGTSGLFVCRKIRETDAYPVIFLTAKGEEIDQINGLAMGADDYITKPFRPLEMVARVKAQLRRYKKYNAPREEEDILTRGALTINVRTHECHLGGKELKLTPTEFSVLEILCRKKGSVVSSEELFHAIWQDEYYSRKTTRSPYTSGTCGKKWGIPSNTPNTLKQSGGADIKLKITKILWKPAAAAVFSLIGVYLLYGFADHVLNGMFVDWFTRNFTTTVAAYYDPQAGYVGTHEEIYWPALKSFLLWTLCLLAVLVALLIFFLTERSRRKLKCEQAKELEKLRVEQKRQQEILKGEMQRKDDLIAYLAHDLKTPLTSVIGYLSFLTETPKMPEEQRQKYLDTALSKSERLEGLINEFFDITRYNLQKIPLEKQKVNLCALLVQVTEELYPILEQHGNTIQNDVDEEEYLYADPEKMARVFNNLLKNAAAYSDPDTPIVIRSERSVDSISIMIENTGVTIPEEKLEIIFEKFFRLDSSRAQETGGSGLGLAIAREIARQHGGDITARSRDRRTCFAVRLPAWV